MKTKNYLHCLSLVLAVAGLAACDKASPVAPAGTVLSITANPTQIGANGTSQIRVVALRANGTPVNPGTQIRMSSNLGTIDPLVEVGEGGVALGTLRGDGRIGTAEVTATVGADTSATVEVAVGKAAANITLQATPPQVPKSTGGTVRLLAIVRDDTGEPLANAAVNFQTEVGTLSSSGAILRTNANGQVNDTLRVDPEDLISLPSSQFTVQAVVGSGAATQSDSAVILVVRCEPTPAFEVASGAPLEARITQNTTTGTEPITYFWDKESDGVIDLVTTARVPADAFEYGTGGTKTVTLRAENECGIGFATRDVPVKNPGE